MIKSWTENKLKSLGWFRSAGVNKLIDPKQKTVKLINYMDVYRHCQLTTQIDYQKVTAKDSEICNANVEVGDVLFTPSSEKPTDIGHAGVVLEDLPNTVYSYHLVRFRQHNNTFFDPLFLSYLLNAESAEKHFVTRATGTTRYTLSLSDFKSLEIKYPLSLPEQKAIAGILSKVDEAIEAVETRIKAAERLKKALMQNLLSGKLKPDGTWRSEDEMFMTKYGYAPKDWKYCQIKDLIKEGYIEGVQDGNHGESHPVAAEFVSEGIPFVMASDISNGFIDVDNCKKLTRERADKLRIGFSKNGDVLLSHKASVGYTCIVNEAEPYVMLTPQVTYYRVAPDKLIPEYLMLFFQTYPFQCIVEGLAKQSTRNYIGITNQKKMWIYLPDSTVEQQEVVAQIIQVDDQILNKRSKIQSLKTLKKSLMQNLLTGKVRVDVEKINKLLEEV